MCYNNFVKRRNSVSNKNYASVTVDILVRILKIILLLALIALVFFSMLIGAMVGSVLKEAPEIDPSTIISSMSQTSTIYDDKGELLEKVQTTEYRTVVTLDKIPKNLQDAFVSIEDERFYSHPGVDIIGILASVRDNLTSSRGIRGASTITQQLVRNMYLSNERTLKRKLIEAYLALQVEGDLNKDQILEAFLNKIYLGQGAYGVQEAAQTYFSKNVDELTLAESALFAGIVKSISSYQPYMRILPGDYNPDKMELLGQAEILGQNMYLIYNPESVERQKIVLAQMKKLNKIDEEEYEKALKQDILATLKPGQKVYHNMTNYFVDFVQTEATELLAEHYKISYEDAQKKLFNDGLQIYSTIDVNLQNNLEYMYDHFTEIMSGGGNVQAPFLLDWSRDGNENIVDASGKIVYYKLTNMLSAEHEVVLPQTSYEVLDDGLLLKSKIFNAYNDAIDIADVYSINEENNLVVHDIGPIVIPKNQYSKNESGQIKISKAFLDENKDFYSINENGALILNNMYYSFQKEGIVQPQSATVIMDYRKGEVKALVGGRDVKGTMILNRATSSRRQPGSAIKPISVYLPALASGKTAGSTADDVPITVGGKAWPTNAYKGYKGLTTYRNALNVSSNAGTVNVLDQIGFDTSLEYLEKMGIIHPENPKGDSIVTREENSQVNDENFSALALGGMTKGLTPLELTAAYATIANDGTYIKPKVVNRILDKNGNTIIDDTIKSTQVTDVQTAYIMKDMLRTVVKDGYTAKPAALSNMITAGKTGTTQERADIWFVGFSPYYVMGTWIGNDSPKVTLKKGSLAAAQFWNKIGEKIHEGLDPITEFEKPEGIVSATIDTKCGKLATKDSVEMGNSTTEIFKEGTQPTEYTTNYKSATICEDTELLATKYCPHTMEKFIFVRDVPYKASEHGGYVPDDAGFVPEEYCNVHTKEAYEDYMRFYYNNPFGPGFIFRTPSSNDDDD